MKTKLGKFIATAAFALVSGAASLAHSATITPLSGYEFFNGVRSGNITVGATFAGWTTNGNGRSWHPVPSNNGGVWSATVNYAGSSGIVPDMENSVTVIDGTWFLEGPDGTKQKGRLSGGTVTWPASLKANIGCGPGVATVTVILALPGGPQPAGTISGCLNDTHLDKVFPPKVWGTLQLN